MIRVFPRNRERERRPQIFSYKLWLVFKGLGLMGTLIGSRNGIMSVAFCYCNAISHLCITLQPEEWFCNCLVSTFSADERYCVEELSSDGRQLLQAVCVRVCGRVVCMVCVLCAMCCVLCKPFVAVNALYGTYVELKGK